MSATDGAAPGASALDNRAPGASALDKGAPLGTAPPGTAPAVSIKLDAVVLDCPDPLALAEFYADLLGLPILPDGTDTWQSLDAGESGISLGFQRADRYTPPGWPDGPPQQLHLDLVVDDFASSHERAVELGATPLSPVTPPEPDKISGFRVYADPVGHPFCLCR